MIVGLTGGVASGKSLCSSYFAEQGAAVIDADIIAREVVEKGQPALAQLVEIFGTSILNADEGLDRAALRNVIFSHDESLSRVNRILHPAIRERMLWQCSQIQRNEIAFLVVPLLFENELTHLCEAVVFVDLTLEKQVERGTKRDQASADDFIKIINKQLPRLEKLRQANFIIDNGLSKADALAQCAALLRTIKNGLISSASR